MNHKNTPEGFYARVDKNGPNGCWSWLGSTNKLGYGQLGYQGRRTTSHRLSYELNKGEIPEGQIVRHDCDNPNCCNPDHLRLGTHQDNANDRKERGRKRGPAGAPSINPRFKSVTEREAERYGTCEEGHTLSPNNLRTLKSGSVVCSACYWINRGKEDSAPIGQAELDALDAFKAAIRAVLDSVPLGQKRRTAMSAFQLLRDLFDEAIQYD